MTQNIKDVRPIFRPDNNVTLKTVTNTFFQELDQDFGSFEDHILLSQFSFDTDWDTWEMHPNGDEFVMLISGETDFVLSVDGVETSEHLANPGDYVIVPRGAWHQARPQKATTCMFVTPGEGTQNALEPGGEPL